MRKILLSVSAGIFIFCGETIGQVGQKFATGLNNLSGTDALGSSNNFPLIIKTNGTEWVRVTPSGNVGIGVIAPADKLQVAGRVNAIHFKADSLMQALDMKAASAEFAIALITGNLNVNGQITAGSLTVSGNTQLANVTANNATINGQLTTGNIIVGSSSSSGSIVSPSGSIDFGNNNLSTSGNISSSNISSLTTDVSNLQSSINNIQSSQWSTNPDSSISFPGNVFVKTLNATDFVSIGSFRFSNGGAVPVPIIRDTIRSPNEVVVHSEAEKIMLSANQVEAQQQLGVGKTPGTNIALDVLGNIQASGNISSSSITTSQLAINGAIEADTMHSRKQMLVNNSLKLAKEDTATYAEISAVNSGIALVLQKDTASNVGIGTTPAAGEKLTVAGNVGISGNLRLTNFSGSDNRILFIDANGNVNKMQNPCPGLEPFWKTDGNFVPPFTTCDVFIGTTNATDLIFKTDANGIGGERMRITSTGNIGIGTNPNTLSNTQGNYKIDINGDMRIITAGSTSPGAGGNMVFKTSYGAGGEAEAKVGIGTENPVRSLHIYTSHFTTVPPPVCDPNDPTCISLPGSHNGMRLEDLTQIGTNPPARSIWDIAPIPGKLVIGTGNLTNNTISAKMVMLNNGNIGIGTSNPQEKLHVDGRMIVAGSDFILGTNDGRNQGTKTDNRALVHDGWLTGLDNLVINYDGDFEDGVFVGGPKMIVDGNVGIGTSTAPAAKLDVNGNSYFAGPVAINTASLPNLSTPFPGNYQLAVNGLVLAIEYNAKVTGEWPDFVFKQKLLSWMEFQSQVEQLGHFPGLPSAKEVHNKKTFGLAEVQMGHLTITEYLYRYLGETKNEVTLLKQENKQLRQHNKELELRLENIEKMLGKK